MFSTLKNPLSPPAAAEAPPAAAPAAPAAAASAASSAPELATLALVETASAAPSASSAPAPAPAAAALFLMTFLRVTVSTSSPPSADFLTMVFLSSLLMPLELFSPRMDFLMRILFSPSPLSSSAPDEEEEEAVLLTVRFSSELVSVKLDLVPAFLVVFTQVFLTQLVPLKVEPLGHLMHWPLYIMYPSAQLSTSVLVFVLASWLFIPRSPNSRALIRPPRASRASSRGSHQGSPQILGQQLLQRLNHLAMMSQQPSWMGWGGGIGGGRGGGACTGVSTNLSTQTIFSTGTCFSMYLGTSTGLSMQMGLSTQIGLSTQMVCGGWWTGTGTSTFIGGGVGRAVNTDDTSCGGPVGTTVSLAVTAREALMVVVLPPPPISEALMATPPETVEPTRVVDWPTTAGATTAGAVVTDTALPAGAQPDVQPVVQPAAGAQPDAQPVVQPVEQPATGTAVVVRAGPTATALPPVVTTRDFLVVIVAPGCRDPAPPMPMPDVWTTPPVVQPEVSPTGGGGIEEGQPEPNPLTQAIVLNELFKQKIIGYGYASASEARFSAPIIQNCFEPAINYNLCPSFQQNHEPVSHLFLHRSSLICIRILKFKDQKAKWNKQNPLLAKSNRL